MTLDIGLARIARQEMTTPSRFVPSVDNPEEKGYDTIHHYDENNREGMIMNKHFYAIGILVILLQIVACSQKSENTNKTVTIISEQTTDFPISLAGLTKYYYEKIKYSVKFSELSIFDRYHFGLEHNSEIVRTLRIKDSLITKNISIVFLTYSISSLDYNDVVWFRKIDGRWYLCVSQYFSSYSDDPFGDGLPEGAKEIIKRADEWKKKNKSMWWD